MKVTVLNWLRRLFNKPPSFRYEALEPGLWRCLACHPNRVVWQDQLGFHAKAKHGWRAPNVRITNQSTARTKVVPL